MENKIKSILIRYFPTWDVKDIRILDRPNGDKTMRCTVNGLIIYMSYLSKDCLQEIYQLIN